MIKKKLKGTVLGLIAAATVMSGSTGVLAADPTSFNNSTSSSVSSSNVFTAGSDTSQGKTGSMTDKSIGGTTSTPTESTSQSVSVYATKASSVSIKVPQVLIGNSTKSEYLVGVKGDVTSKQSVTVAPSATMTQQEAKLLRFRRPKQTGRTVIYLQLMLMCIPKELLHMMH